MDIAELQQICYRNAEKKGWHDKPITFADACVLLHSEISEAYEEFRNNHHYTEIYYNGIQDPDINKNKPEGIPIELADLVIRLCHYAEYFGINLEAAIDLKMDYNATRPYRHGNKQS